MPIRISKNRVALENIPLNEAQGADIASASTVNLDNATGNLIDITGTTTITTITLSRGYERTARFTGSLVLTHGASLILPGSANVTTSAGDFAVFRGYASGVVRCVSYIKSSGEAVVGSGNTYNLTNIIYPRADGDWRGIYRSGWRPSFFNQQWGGAQWGNLPDGSFGDVATGWIEHIGKYEVANLSTQTAIFQGFKVSVSQDTSAIWVKIYKTGNPTNNLELRIQADDGSGTKPTANFTAITNGTATAQSGKLHSSNTNGEWVRFVFSTPCALTANTQYWIVLKSSGAVDASNYWNWMMSVAPGKYPHGTNGQGDATPTWTAFTPDCCFLVESVPTTTRFLQSGGQFDGKLTFAEGSPLDQSKGLSQPLKNFFDGYEFTYRGVFSSLTKDKTVADFLYGLDHDRIVLRCNITTGYLQLDVYESDGTKHTVTGTTDCSSGAKDIAIYIRAKGDGSDKVTLYVNGVSEGTPVTSATITFDNNFKDLGTAWLGGGFPITPTWTKDTTMNTLPSADGWTWVATAGVTEANTFSVSGGKLYQNYNGLTATQYSRYVRTTTMSNTNGWTVASKLKVTRADNTAGGDGLLIGIWDGTKFVQIFMHEYYIDTAQLATNHKVQINLTDREHVITVSGKGSDIFLFVDGRLVLDGTGLFTTTAGGTNQISFGDSSEVSGQNSDVIWDYVKDYNTAWLPPQFTAGSLSEAAFFSGDRTSILASLYNGGTLKSVREYCGVEGEYTQHIETDDFIRGITPTPTTTSTTPVLLTDLERFVIGEKIRLDSNVIVYHGTVNQYVHIGHAIDGILAPDTFYTGQATANLEILDSIYSLVEKSCGLHKAEARWKVNTGTGTSPGDKRYLTVSVK